ncbi:MAG: vWA domain-containing protein [Pseudomonadota bacterium]
MICAFTTSAFAQAPEAAKPSDVRIIIDVSGSMKKNDPQNLRRPALDMLIKLLPEDSKAGVWTFGQYVNMLVKHRLVDEQWKQEASNDAQTINSVAQFTNIGEALEKASYDKHYSTKDQFQTHLILLTDGMVDIARDPAANVMERNRILNEILPGYQDAGFTIHTISLSDNADKKLMDRLSLATNGQSVVAKSADELMQVFLQVFNQAVPKEEVPLEGNSFFTDSSIEEFTALIFRQPGSPQAQLISPDQTAYTKATKDPTVSWFGTNEYDLITVKQPLEGEWRILADLEPQSRVTVVSDLSLVVKPIPTNLLINDQVDLSLALREENKVIKRAEFLNLLDIDVTVKAIDHLKEGGDKEGGDKENGDKQWQKRLSDGLVPGDGVFTDRLDYFRETGQYSITVNVDGKTFQRRFNQQVSVRNAFAVESSVDDKDGKTQYKVMVIPQDQSVNLGKTQVVGKLKDPSGASNIKNFRFTDEQLWELLIHPQQQGEYFLTLRITTVNEKGDTNNIIPKPLSFTYPLTDNVFEPDAVVDEQTDIPIDEPVEPEPISTSNTAEPAPEQTSEAEQTPPEKEQPKDYSRWILYGVLVSVNIFIVLIVYILYRKLFKRKTAVADDDQQPGDAKPAAAAAASASGSEEPPMDEMAINDLADDDIDLSTDADAEADPDLDISEDNDPLADLSPDALDDDDAASDDEDPEFSLDDFAPDALDDDDDNK